MTKVRSVMVGMMVAGTVGVGALRADSLAVPFKGNGSGAIIAQEVLGPNHVRLTTEGSGNATHLGTFTRTEVLNLNPAAGSFTGTVTFTAADGDRLDCDVTGQFTSATDAQGDYAITGGTGRFAQASGQVTFYASMTGSTTFRVSFTGDIVW